jgi:hypothetical protein
MPEDEAGAIPNLEAVKGPMRFEDRMWALAIASSSESPRGRISMPAMCPSRRK